MVSEKSPRAPVERPLKRMHRTKGRRAAARRNSRVCSSTTEREPLPTDRIAVRLSRASEPERGRCTAAQEAVRGAWPTARYNWLSRGCRATRERGGLAP